MHSPFRKILVVAAIAFAFAGCNRNSATSQPAPAQPIPTAAAPAAPTPPPAPPIPAATELPLNSVDSLMLSRPADAPMALVIHVAGTAISPGWTDAKLAEAPDDGGNAGVKTYRLVATSPPMPDANRTAQPMEAELRVEALPPDVKTVRIVSATNEISAPVAQ